MTTPPTNDGTGTKPYKVIGINSKAWVEHPDGRRDDFGDDLNRALLVAAKMNLAHAAREPEIAELRDRLSWMTKERDSVSAMLRDANDARLTAEVADTKAAPATRDAGEGPCVTCGKDRYAHAWRDEGSGACRSYAAGRASVPHAEFVAAAVPALEASQVFIENMRNCKTILDAGLLVCKARGTLGSISAALALAPAQTKETE